MDRRPWGTDQKPQILIKQTFDRTKKFFQITFRNLKSFLQERCQKLQNNKVNTKVRDWNCCYGGLPEQCVGHCINEEFNNKEETFPPPKEQIKGEERRRKSSMKAADYILEDSKTEKKQCKKSSMRAAGHILEDSRKEKNFGSKREKESSLMAANALAQKLKELDMMDVNDVDHVLDIEEVIHYYSRLTCSAYQEMVDKFFVDMYLEYNVNPPPLKSRNNSMRKVGSASIHGSMSMRKVGSASIHGSMRSGSMRSLGPIKT